MGFDGAATFSGTSWKVERALISCTVFPLSLSCPPTGSVQTTNATPGIKHVYIILMTLWKLFYYFPKRAVIKGTSESTRSSRAQDCETVRHTLACT